MNQKLIFKQKNVVIQEPKTLKAVLQDALLERGMDIGLLDKIANHIIFSVDNVMVRSLDTIIKVGQTVRLIPAVKAG